MTDVSRGVDDREPVPGKVTTTVALDFGRISLDEALRLYLFGTPGQDRFAFLWDDLVTGALGAVVLLDPNRIEDCFPSLDYFEEHGVPFMVAVNLFESSDRFDITEIREALGVSDDIPVVECDARQRESVKSVLVDPGRDRAQPPTRRDRSGPARTPEERSEGGRVMSRTRRSGPVLGAAVALMLSGCAGSKPELVSAPLPLRTECGAVTLAQNPWVGYDANLAVISYLARTDLDCAVKVKAEAETESWKHLADGSVDAILENWGHDDLKKLYIDERKVAVQGGLTGNTGVIGWYVPPWMAQEYPDITDWRTLKKRAKTVPHRRVGRQGAVPRR